MTNKNTPDPGKSQFLAGALLGFMLKRCFKGRFSLMELMAEMTKDPDIMGLIHSNEPDGDAANLLVDDTVHVVLKSYWDGLAGGAPS